MKINHSLVIGSVLVLIGTLSMTPGFGQGSSRVAMTADVPFDFVVRDTTFPNGEYEVRIQIMSSGQVLFLKGEGQSIMALARAVNAPKEVSNEAKLVFNRYGEDRHFLREIWMPGVAAHEVPICSSERAVVTSSYTFEKITLNLKPLEVRTGK